jgi:hypothetical protein
MAVDTTKEAMMKRTRRILITTLLAGAIPLLATSVFATFMDGNHLIVKVLSEPSMMILFGVMLIAVAGFGKKIRI